MMLIKLFNIVPCGQYMHVCAACVWYSNIRSNMWHFFSFVYMLNRIGESYSARTKQYSFLFHKSVTLTFLFTQNYYFKILI